MSNKKGFFLVFEGIDGCGKSLQIELLKGKLKEEEVVFTQEHTEGVVGELIERVVNKKEIKLDPVALQLLFVADRVDHLQKVIEPALREGKMVISDRYFWSTVAYGSLVAPREWLLELNRFCRLPDLVILLDLKPEISLRRVRKRGGERSIFEERKKLEKVRETYFWLKKKFPKQSVVINGGRTPKEIHEEVLKVIKKRR